MKNLGFIQLIIGPMFSGKSSQMVRKVRRYQHARKKCLIVNSLKENRNSLQGLFAKHDGLATKIIKTTTIQEIKAETLQYDVVAIDEGQFYPDIVQEAESLANSGIIVIIAALDGTFQRKPFGNVLNLVPMAEFVTKLTAVCIGCGAEAPFTQRTIESQEIQLIGREEAYQPVCRKCYGLGSKTVEQKAETNKIPQTTQDSLANRQKKNQR